MQPRPRVLVASQRLFLASEVWYNQNFLSLVFAGKVSLCVQPGLRNERENFTHTFTHARTQAAIVPVGITVTGPSLVLIGSVLVVLIAFEHYVVNPLSPLNILRRAEALVGLERKT